MSQVQQLGSNRIQMDVVDQTHQRPSWFHQQGLVTSLEHMSALAGELVKAVAESTLEPAHSFHEVSLGSLQGQVIVVTHNHVGMQHPATTFTGFEEGILKLFSGLGHGEQVLAVVAAGQDMVDCSRILNARFSGHGRKPWTP